MDLTLLGPQLLCQASKAGGASGTSCVAGVSEVDRASEGGLSRSDRVLCADHGAEHNV